MTDAHDTADTDRERLERAGWRSWDDYSLRWWVRPGQPDRLYEYRVALALLRHEQANDGS
jgi:hypothetical protein